MRGTQSHLPRVCSETDLEGVIRRAQRAFTRDGVAAVEMLWAVEKCAEDYLEAVRYFVVDGASERGAGAAVQFRASPGLLTHADHQVIGCHIRRGLTQPHVLEQHQGRLPLLTSHPHPAYFPKAHLLQQACRHGCIDVLLKAV